MEKPCTFESLTVEYIDSMPPRSKVNYPDLVAVVMERWSIPTWQQNAHLGTSHRSAGCWTARDIAVVNRIVHDIVATRTDLTVERGRGICKR
jgi:hypothetical protein